MQLTFLWKITVFQNQKKFHENNDLAYFSNFLNIWHNRRQWILISASALKVLQYSALVKIYKENLDEVCEV